jgi:outer membrane protein OmpU
VKKALYGTTALVAAGLAAGQALADGGIKLDISGFYRGSAGVLIGGDQTPVNVHSHTVGGGLGATTAIGGLGDFGRTSGGFRQEIRINFQGDITLPDGITVGVLVGIDPAIGGSAATAVNRAYTDFKGQYGDLRFGTGDPLDAVKQDCIYDPGNVTSNFGINSANEDFTNAGLGAVGGAGTTVGVATFETAAATCVTFTQKGTSIAYFSPTFAGFSLALSYTPGGGIHNSSGSQGVGAGTDLKKSQAENILSAAADYNADLGGGWTFLAGGGGQWAFSGHTTAGGPEHNRPSAYLFGFQVANPSGWTFGASGEYFVNYPNFAGTFAATDAGTSGADGWSGAAGVAYTVGKISVGLQGIYSRYEVHSNTAHDAIWGVGLNGAYTLGPGVTLEGQIAYTKYDPGVGAPSSTNPMSYDAVELDAGVAINF